MGSTQAMRTQTAAGLLLALWAVAAAQQQEGERSALLQELEIAARFEALGRVSEARARVLEVQARHPSHPTPALALQRMDAARCPLPPQPAAAQQPPSGNDDGNDCPWLWVDSPSAPAPGQCAAGDAACQSDGTAVRSGGDFGVHVLEVRSGSCAVLIEGDRRRLEQEGLDSDPSTTHQAPSAAEAVYALSVRRTASLQHARPVRWELRHVRRCRP